MQIKNLFGSTLALAALAYASTGASAPITYSCSAGDNCNGNEYGWSAENTGVNEWLVSVGIKVNDTYTGNWSDLINSIQLSSFIGGGHTISSASILAAPGGAANWLLTSNQLSANGCHAGNTTGVCAEWKGSGYGFGFTTGNILTWTFQVVTLSPAAVNELGHIKYLYVNSRGKKVGDLGSFDLGRTTVGVPEPGSLALLGLGLIGIGLARRRRMMPRSA